MVTHTSITDLLTLTIRRFHHLYGTICRVIQRRNRGE